MAPCRGASPGPCPPGQGTEPSLGDTGNGPQISAILSTKGDWKSDVSQLPLAAKGHRAKVFNVKTSDKVPAGCICCIKEVALGNSHSSPTRELECGS
jgi:hypothetical protein